MSFDRMIALIAGDPVPLYVPAPSVVQWGDRQVEAVIKDHDLAYIYRRYTIERVGERTWAAKRPDDSIVAYFKAAQDAPAAIDEDWEALGGWPTLDMSEEERRGLIEVTVQAAYVTGMTWNYMRLYYMLGLAINAGDWEFAREVFNAELYR